MAFQGSLSFFGTIHFHQVLQLGFKAFKVFIRDIILRRYRQASFSFQLDTEEERKRGRKSVAVMKHKSKLSQGPGQVLIKQRTQAAMKERQARATASHNKPLESQIDVRDLDEVMEQAELAGKVFSALNPLPELLINP